MIEQTQRGFTAKHPLEQDLAFKDNYPDSYYASGIYWKVRPKFMYNDEGKVVTSLTPDTNIKNVLSNKAFTRLSNSMNTSLAGAQQNITTLTARLQGVIAQQYYDLGMYEGKKITLEDFISTRYSPLTWASEVAIAKQFNDAPIDFEQGVVADGSSQFYKTSTNITQERYPVITWANELQWNFIQVGQFDQSGYGVDLMIEQELSRKKHHDYGLNQMLLGTGLKDYPTILGLLNQSTVTPDTTTITTYPSQMSDNQFIAMLSNLPTTLAAQLQQTPTALPNVFALDAFEIMKLKSTPFTTTFGVMNRFDKLQEAFMAISQGEGKILPLQYTKTGVNSLGHNRYVMYRNDEQTFFYSPCVPYTILSGNQTINGAQFQNVSYSRTTGAILARPQTMVYFDF